MPRSLPTAAALCAPVLAFLPLSATAATGPQVVARTVAAWADVKDSSGRVWTARRGLLGGPGNSVALVGKEILGTTEDALYRTSSYGATGYAMPVAAGRYRVRLLMAEGYWTRAGQRVFDVSAEGRPVLAAVDIVAAVGRGTAYERAFQVDVTDGSLSVAFGKVVDNPLIAAVEVTMMGAPGSPPTPDDPPTGITPSPTTATTTAAAPTSAPSTTTTSTAPANDPSTVPTSAPTSAPTTVPTTPPPPAETLHPATEPPTTAVPTARVVARTVAAYVDVRDPAGNLWTARNGLVGADMISNALAGTDVTGTTDDVLYQTLTFGSTGYDIPVARGRHRVRLLLAEDYYTRAGQRVFDVRAQGLTVLTGVDIAGAVGRGAAYERVFEVDVTTDRLTLEFVAVRDRPQLAAIEVSALSTPDIGTTTAAPTTTSPTTTSPDPTSTDTPEATPTNTPPTPSSSPSAPTQAPTGTPTQTPTPAGKAPIPLAWDSPWLTRIESAPLDPNSAVMAANLLADVANNWGGVAAFNNTHYNPSFYPVPAGQPRIDVDFWNCQNKTWIDPNLTTGPAYFMQVPVPDDARPAVGTDGELTVYDASTDQLWEFWQMRRNATTNRWEACWGGRIDNLSMNPGIFQQYYGVTGSGVAMAAGMISIDEVRRGAINHALYLGVMNAQAYPVMSWPALRTDGNVSLPDIVREGQRLRLDPALDLRAYPLSPVGRMVAQAAQRYGFIVSDRAGAVAVVGEAGLREGALTGSDPWGPLLGGIPPYEVLRNFPWGAIQVVQADYGKPADPIPPVAGDPITPVAGDPSVPVFPSIPITP